MDIGNRFSLEDFLAYFFPGVTTALGIYILIQITSANSSLPSLTADITTGIIFFVLSYILGVIISSFAELLFSRIHSNKDVIPLKDELKQITIATFRDVFKVPKNAKIEWSRDHFYLCRSVVYERVPNVLPFLQRQSSLRQLRISLIPTLFIWMVVGVVWGAQTITSGQVIAGLIIIASAIILFVAITLITINRARSNEWREVREVITAFNASYRKSPEQQKTEVRKG